MYENIFTTNYVTIIYDVTMHATNFVGWLAPIPLSLHSNVPKHNLFYIIHSTIISYYIDSLILTTWSQ